MKMPRTTCRTLMIVIAISALAAWGYTLHRRSEFFTAKAREHHIDCIFYHAAMSNFDDGRTMDDSQRAIRETYHRWFEYEDGLVRKYRLAARLPMLPLGPDPDPPAGPLPVNPLRSARRNASRPSP